MLVLLKIFPLFSNYRLIRELTTARPKCICVCVHAVSVVCEIFLPKVFRTDNVPKTRSKARQVVSSFEYVTSTNARGPGAQAWIAPSGSFPIERWKMCVY